MVTVLAGHWSWAASGTLGLTIAATAAAMSWYQTTTMFSSAADRGRKHPCSFWRSNTWEENIFASFSYCYLIPWTFFQKKYILAESKNQFSLL